LKRLGYVDRPHALCLQFAHSRRLYRRRPAKRITRLARIEQAPTGEWCTSRHNRLILPTISISLKSANFVDPLLHDSDLSNLFPEALHGGAIHRRADFPQRLAGPLGRLQEGLAKLLKLTVFRREDDSARSHLSALSLVLIADDGAFRRQFT
jgi:hypothetical protein